MNQPHMPGQPRAGGNVCWFLCIGMQTEALWHLPDEDFAIVGSRSNERVVERTPVRRSACVIPPPSRSFVPVSVEYSGGMAAEEGYLLWETAALVDGNDSKRATTAGFPIDGDVFWVGLSRVLVQICAQW